MREKETLRKNGQLNSMIDILKTLYRELNDYRRKHKFFKKYPTDYLICEYLTPKSHTNSQTSHLFNIFEFNCSRQKYLDIKKFVNM